MGIRLTDHIPSVDVATARPLPDDLDPGHICLIKPSALGDVVQSLPVLASIRQRWPRAHIAWVIKQSLANVLDRRPDLDEIIEYDDRVWPRWTGVLNTCRKLLKKPFDLTVDLQGLARSGAMTLATGACYRVGFANAREFSPLAYSHRVRVPTMEMPATERYWLVARALGAGTQLLPSAVILTPYLRAWAKEQLGSLPQPRLAVHPGSRWATKRIPTGHYVRLLNLAWREFQAGAVLLGGGDDVSRCGEIASQLKGPFLSLAGNTTIQQLAALSAEVDTFVAGDTGPLHLAATMGTPVVGLYTCTSPVRAQPPGKRALIVQTQVPCAESYLRRCPLMACMGRVDAEPNLAGRGKSLVRSDEEGPRGRGLTVPGRVPTAAATQPIRSRTIPCAFSWTDDEVRTAEQESGGTRFAWARNFSPGMTSRRSGSRWEAKSDVSRGLRPAILEAAPPSTPPSGNGRRSSSPESPGTAGEICKVAVSIAAGPAGTSIMKPTTSRPTSQSRLRPLSVTCRTSASPS